MADKTGARQRWELENDIQDIQSDAYYKYDAAEQQALQQQKPWTKDPHYFKNVRISALALLKMAMHAKSGGNLEIMGMLYGKVQGDTFIVIDAFALPVEGTETRVNAQAEAYEYMVDFAETNKAVGRLENMVGWYHSHPGYGCWLSGIDVSTQSIQQQYQEPFLAIVVDPHRTIAAGKVEIGAFRTYPEHYKPPDEKPSEYQTIPLSKIEDFGVHANSYYSLDISYFKSSLDAGLLDQLWGKYWVNTLASSPLLATRDLTAGQMRDIAFCKSSLDAGLLDQLYGKYWVNPLASLPLLATRDLTAGQMRDIADKLEACEGQLSHSGRMGRFVSSGSKKDAAGDQQLHKICCDANKLALEHIKGMSGQIVKDLLFNRAIVPAAGPASAATGSTEAAPMES